jgi:hypothetical protein
MDIKNMITAEQNALTITPDRRSESFFMIDWPEDMPRIMRSVAILPIKAVILTPGNLERPARMPIMAPIAEPPETPRI